ncbi:hypothetical protein UlMin_034035 [Ulmus minor]
MAPSANPSSNHNSPRAPEISGNGGDSPHFRRSNPSTLRIQVVRREPESTAAHQSPPSSSSQSEKTHISDCSTSAPPKPAWKNPSSVEAGLGVDADTDTWPDLIRARNRNFNPKQSADSSFNPPTVESDSNSQGPVITHSPPSSQVNANPNSTTRSRPPRRGGSRDSSSGGGPAHRSSIHPSIQLLPPSSLLSLAPPVAPPLAPPLAPLVPPPLAPPVPPPLLQPTIPDPSLSNLGNAYYNTIIPDHSPRVPFHGNQWNTRSVTGFPSEQLHNHRNSSHRGNFTPHQHRNGGYHNNYSGRRPHGRGNFRPYSNVHNPIGHFRPEPNMHNPIVPVHNPIGYENASPFTPTFNRPLVSYGNNGFYPSNYYFIDPNLMLSENSTGFQYNSYTPTPEVYSLVKQIDYYFSDANLVKDEYLRSNMDDQGWVPVSLIATFPRVERFKTTEEVILTSLTAFSTDVEVQDKKIRKRDNWMKWLPTGQLSIRGSNLLTSSFENLSMENTASGRNNIVAGADTN